MAKPCSPKELGGSLRAIKQEFLHSEDYELTSIWLQGEKDVDLFLWKDEEGRILKQQISFYGKFAEWNIVEGTKTGASIKGSVNFGIKASDEVEYHEKNQPEILQEAFEISRHCMALNEVDRIQCEANWRASRLAGLGSFADFLEEYRATKKYKPRYFLKRLWGLLWGKKP